MNHIYIYDGPFEKGSGGYALVRRAAERYCQEVGLTIDVQSIEIAKEDKGKPFFVDTPLGFSLTHSENLWMCMISQNPCGLDLQVVKPCNTEGIAKRNYTPEEQHYVTLWGIDGFFDVWVRKEAFCKHTGQGFFTQMPSMVNGQGDLVDQVEWKGITYYLKEIFIADYLKCAVCTSEKTEIEIRSLT